MGFSLPRKLVKDKKFGHGTITFNFNLLKHIFYLQLDKEASSSR